MFTFSNLYKIYGLLFTTVHIKIPSEMEVPTIYTLLTLFALLKLLNIA